MSDLLEVKNLKKYYGDSGVAALNGLSINFERGKVIGVLGPNGAGKSTLFKCINKLISYDDGEIKFLEITDKQVGFLPEGMMAYEFLTGRDLIFLITKMREMDPKQVELKMKEMDAVLDFPPLNQLVSTYSKGNKEKLLIFLTFMHEPEIVFMDEPFTGLDPVVILKVKRYIREYAAKGHTVVLSTHYLEMASQLCDEVAIIYQGVVKKRCSMENSMTDGARFSYLEKIYMEELGENA